MKIYLILSYFLFLKIPHYIHYHSLYINMILILISIYLPNSPYLLYYSKKISELVQIILLLIAYLSYLIIYIICLN